jgi:hypothetical protein
MNPEQVREGLRGAAVPKALFVSRSVNVTPRVSYVELWVYTAVGASG